MPRFANSLCRFETEVRTGDTPASKRARQRQYPPDILVTTPEQLSLLLAGPDARSLFGDLHRVVLDELHALVVSKRGDLLALALARLRQIAPQMRSTGLSATVRDPDLLRRYLTGDRPARLIVADPGTPVYLAILDPHERLPWCGHSAHQRSLCADSAGAADLGFCEHPLAGGIWLPRALA